jgi:tRNA(fMet)-specific endonuclease VapC
VRNAVAYLKAHQQFSFSAITRYEVMRGLKSKAASRQLQQFQTFCQHSTILQLSDAIFDRAGDLWVATHSVGRPKGDADLLIAATALIHGFTLVTGNVNDFAWIPGLTIEDWR